MLFTVLAVPWSCYPTHTIDVQLGIGIDLERLKVNGFQLPALGGGGSFSVAVSSGEHELEFKVDGSWYKATIIADDGDSWLLTQEPLRLVRGSEIVLLEPVSKELREKKVAGMR